MSYGAGLTYYVCSGNAGSDVWDPRPFCGDAASRKLIYNAATYRYICQNCGAALVATYSQSLVQGERER